MELVNCELNSEKFDAVISGRYDAAPTLKDGGDLEVFFKPRSTANGKGSAVLTFTVQLPDGSFARAQTVTTATLLDMLGSAARGWAEGGFLS